MAAQRGRGRRPSPARSRGRRRDGQALRIAAHYVQNTANCHYRVEMPLRELERRGHEVLWPGQYDPHAVFAGRPDFDVFLMHHFFSEEALGLVELLSSAGVAVVWDKDDDIEATPKWVPAYKAYGGRRGVKRSFAQSVAVARASSLMTTPSPHLASRYRAEGVAHVEVIENYLAPEDIGLPRPRHPGVVIGMCAGAEHRGDHKALGIDKALARLLRAREGVRVVSIGEDHDLPAGRHTRHAQVPITELVKVEREFDIGLAPLVDSAFNRARSDVKLKEYAAAGAMWLASPVGPYAGYGEEQGGLLVEDDGWFAALDEMVTNYRRRQELAERARAWARSQSMDRSAARWESAFRGAFARRRSDDGRAVAERAGTR